MTQKPVPVVAGIVYNDPMYIVTLIARGPATVLLFFITFVVTLIFDVTGGLLVGVIGCLLALTEKQRNLELVPLVHVHGTEIFLPDNRKFKTTENENFAPGKHLTLPCIMTFQLTGALNFASGEQLNEKLKKLIIQQQHKVKDQILRKKSLMNHLDSVRKADDKSAEMMPNQALMDASGPDYVSPTPCVPPTLCVPSTARAPPTICDEISAGRVRRTTSSGSQRSSEQNGPVNDSHWLKSTTTEMLDETDDGSCVSILTLDKPQSPAVSGACITIDEESTPKAFLLIDITGMTHIDPTGLEFLRESHNELFNEHICMVYAGGECSE
ncbi:unnamed protein product [Echinostoma caproni]|uniref:STAS domain-containing protein n=1 Tax=Echinostoma caproni TaxID=27848 RepID=A0A183B4V4_9TREM|nr:unnamed protein product [Echinostoma caproni]